jgi:DNA primase
MRNQPRPLTVDDLKHAISPHEFYLREQELCRFGYRSGPWVTAGLCPFHEDHSAGSFKVNLDKGAFICFSCGAKGGDIIAFIQQK